VIQPVKTRTTRQKYPNHDHQYCHDLINIEPSSSYGIWSHGIFGFLGDLLFGGNDMEDRIDQPRLEQLQFATQTSGVIKTAAKAFETSELRMKSKLVEFE
jgi:hypothetical protein